MLWGAAQAAAYADAFAGSAAEGRHVVAHASPVCGPTFVQAVDGNLPLARLEVIKECSDRVKVWCLADEQLSYDGLFNTHGNTRQ